MAGHYDFDFGDQATPAQDRRPQGGYSDAYSDLTTQQAPYSADPAATQPYDQMHQTGVTIRAQDIAAEYWFWSMEAAFTLPNTDIVHGTYEQLFVHYPALRRDILSSYDILSSFNPTGQEIDGGESGGQQFDDLFPEIMRGEQTVAQASQTARTDEPAATKEVESEQRSAKDLGRPESDVKEDADDAESDEQPATGSGSGPPHLPPSESSRPTETPTSDAKAAIRSRSCSPPRHEQSVPAQETPQYTEDICSPAAARETIAHADPADCKRLQVKHDNVEAVKSQPHIWAKKLFDALLTGGIDDLTPRIQNRKTPVAEVNKRFVSQQQEAKSEIAFSMKTPKQLKNARARCILLIDAVVWVHENGVPEELYEDVFGGRKQKSNRYAHCDAYSTCSKRLTKIIGVVRDYKSTALDVLKGHNIHDFVYDPEYYPQKRVDYLLSNLQRQRTIDKQRAVEEKAMAKNRQAADGEMDEGQADKSPAERRSGKRKYRDSVGAADQTEANADGRLQDGKRGKKER